MALVEAIAGEGLHLVEDLIGLGLVDAFFRRPLSEDFTVLRHFLGLLLTHRAAQQVGSAQRVAAHELRSLHHLFLVHKDAVGLRQHFLQQWMRVTDGLLAVLAGTEARDVVHGTGAEHRIECDEVLQPRGLGIAQHGLHAAAFKLEHRFGEALGKQLVHTRIVKRQRLVLEVGALRAA